MADQFEFELVFALPEGEHDALDLSNAVFNAGFEESLVGTGVPGLLGLGVELEAEGDDAESVILEAARALMKSLPAGTKLRTAAAQDASSEALVASTAFWHSRLVLRRLR